MEAIVVPLLAGFSAVFAVASIGSLGRRPAGLVGLMGAIDLGARWRDELQALADRMALPDLRRTVVALTRTETLGASLTSSMTELAERVRGERRAHVTERARTAPVKMLFPLVLFNRP